MQRVRSMIPQFAARNEMQSRATLSGLKVLVLDDEPWIRDLLAAMLAPQGVLVSTAATVADAWETLHTASFDLLISDIQLPHQGGCDLIAMVRSSELEWLQSLPAIAVSGLCDPADQDSFLRAGFD